MRRTRIDPIRASNLLLPMAVAGMIAGFTIGCSEQKAESTATPPAAKAAPAKATEKAGDAVAPEKHSCAGMNSCKGKGGCKTGDNGCAGKNSCKGKGGCEVPPKAK